jgi:hypothetical protein
MTLLERNQTLLERARHLERIAEPVRELLVRGKREQLMSGRDALGVPFAPLLPSTRKNPRRGHGGPLVPDGEASKLITGYQVTIVAGDDELVISAGWPGLSFVRYLKSGTRRMVRRDPGGFRQEDRNTLMDKLRAWVMSGSR